MPKKTGHYEATPAVIADARAASGKRLQYFQSDGEGVFASGETAELFHQEKIRHVWSAPHDSNTNPFIERARRTVLEGTATSLIRSGAPSNFWGEAENHKIFTMNVVPTFEDPEEKGKFVSRKNRLEGNKRPYNLEHLMAFGTAATCYVPIGQRNGGKQPGQRRSFKGAIIGYETNMDAYRVWDFANKKVRVVSFYYTVCHEGYYPFKDRSNWPPDAELLPSCFAPSIGSALDDQEWFAYDFDDEDADEVLSHLPLPEHFHDKGVPLWVPGAISSTSVPTEPAPHGTSALPKPLDLPTHWRRPEGGGEGGGSGEEKHNTPPDEGVGVEKFFRNGSTLGKCGPSHALDEEKSFKQKSPAEISLGKFSSGGDGGGMLSKPENLFFEEKAKESQNFSRLQAHPRHDDTLPSSHQHEEAPPHASSGKGGVLGDLQVSKHGVVDSERVSANTRLALRKRESIANRPPDGAATSPPGSLTNPTTLRGPARSGGGVRDYSVAKDAGFPIVPSSRPDRGLEMKIGHGGPVQQRIVGPSTGLSHTPQTFWRWALSDGYPRAIGSDRVPPLPPPPPPTQGGIQGTKFVPVAPSLPRPCPPAPPPVLDRSGKGGSDGKSIAKIMFSQVPETDFLVLSTEKPACIPPPKTLREAKLSPWWPQYKRAAEEEISGLEKNFTWVLVPISTVPRGKNILRGKFVFDDKRGPDGKILRFKARFVAMGFTQKAGIDYFETYAGVANTKSFRIMLVILNSDKTFSMEHWDVKMAFTVAPVTEELYMSQPEGFIPVGKENFVCRLKKSLYGLKQSAKNWKDFCLRVACGAHFAAAHIDNALFYRRDETGFCLVAFHVDDVFPLYDAGGKVFRDELFKAFSDKCEISNLGEISWALKTAIKRDRENGVLKISQESFCKEFLEKKGLLGKTVGCDTPAVETGPDAEMTEEDFPKTEDEQAELKDCTFQEDIGSLYWLAAISRPDIYFAVHRASKYQNRPSKKLWRWLDRIKKYLVKTMRVGIVFERKNFDCANLFSAFCDASFASEMGAKSRIGWFYFFGGGLVSWASENPTRVLSSSTEAECVALTKVCKENLWHRNFHAELALFPLSTTRIYEDNTACIALFNSARTTHKRSKHFEIDFYLCKECVERKEVEIVYVSTDKQNADTLTKALGKEKFLFFRECVMGVKEKQDHFEEKVQSNLLRVGMSDYYEDGEVEGDEQPTYSPSLTYSPMFSPVRLDPMPVMSLNEMQAEFKTIGESPVSQALGERQWEMMKFVDSIVDIKMSFVTGEVDKRDAALRNLVSSATNIITGPPSFTERLSVAQELETYMTALRVSLPIGLCSLESGVQGCTVEGTPFADNHAAAPVQEPAVVHVVPEEKMDDKVSAEAQENVHAVDTYRVYASKLKRVEGLLMQKYPNGIDQMLKTKLATMMRMNPDQVYVINPVGMKRCVLRSHSWMCTRVLDIYASELVAIVNDDDKGSLCRCCRAFFPTTLMLKDLIALPIFVAAQQSDPQMHLYPKITKPKRKPSVSSSSSSSSLDEESGMKKSRPGVKDPSSSEDWTDDEKGCLEKVWWMPVEAHMFKNIISGSCDFVWMRDRIERDRWIFMQQTGRVRCKAAVRVSSCYGMTAIGGGGADFSVEDTGAPYKVVKVVKISFPFKRSRESDVDGRPRAIDEDRLLLAWKEIHAALRNGNA